LQNFGGRRTSQRRPRLVAEMKSWRADRKGLGRHLHLHLHLHLFSTLCRDARDRKEKNAQRFYMSGRGQT